VCVCVCVCVCVYVREFICMYACIHTHTHTHTHLLDRKGMNEGGSVGQIPDTVKGSLVIHPPGPAAGVGLCVCV
jgi:hypothetical protein